jgi:inositol-1,3,4-trisphosphate 5/6-kinase/inositol-tetrakisphosphate 1-kinase
VGVPRQLVITGDAASIPSSVAKAGLKLPLVVKPLVADGTAKSHAMSLAYDKYCLTELDPPLVLQEFVNHGITFFFPLDCWLLFHVFEVENFLVSCSNICLSH